MRYYVSKKLQWGFIYHAFLFIFITRCFRKRHYDVHFQPFHDSTPIKALVSLHIHTSQATLFRLSENFQKYRVDSEYIKYYFVSNPNITGPFPKGINVIPSNCNDVVSGEKGLICRDIASYEYFLKHPEDGDWLFRAMDDTIVNINNLLKLIYKLNRLYEPSRHVVFRGCKNYVCRRRWYLGGGSGWLSSRAMVELHQYDELSFLRYFNSSFCQQDDTTETIIIQQVFKDEFQWSDPLWSENCFNCNGDDIANNSLSGITLCTESLGSAFYKADDIISFHPQHRVRNAKMINVFGKLPNNLYFAKMKHKDGITICRLMENSKIGVEDTFEFMKKHAHKMTVQQVIQRIRNGNAIFRCLNDRRKVKVW